MCVTGTFIVTPFLFPNPQQLPGCFRDVYYPFHVLYMVFRHRGYYVASTPLVLCWVIKFPTENITRTCHSNAIHFKKLQYPDHLWQRLSLYILYRIYIAIQTSCPDPSWL